MSRSLVAWLAAAVLVVAGAAFAYVFYFAGGSGEPSTELTTPAVAASTTSTGRDPTVSSTSATTTPAANAGTAFVLDPEQTTASFEIGEVLRGEPMTVVGATSEVAGQVVIDPDDLGESRFSDIVVNARTFMTDSDRRDRTIRGPVVLDSASDEHELITFTPARIDGLDGVPAVPGETHEFTVTGDLTIKGTTNPVSFDVTAEMVDASTVEGTATTEIMRTDFGIGIPSVPFVADVTDEVHLSLEFVATSG